MLNRVRHLFSLNTAILVDGILYQQRTMMKTKLISLAFASLILAGCSPHPQQPSAAYAAEHNARIALDWAGTYRGELPCADCDGIQTTVILDSNGRYETKAEYVGKKQSPVVDTGTVTWGASGNTITLGHNDPQQYFVSENRLIRLATDGSRITGPIAEKYVLNKVDAGK